MKKLLSALLAGLSIFCFSTHINSNVIHSDSLEGTLASMHKRYWQWSPVTGYHLYMNTDKLEQAMTEAYNQPTGQTSASDVLLLSFFVYDLENGRYEAQNAPQSLVTYFSPQTIGIIVRFIYQLPCYLKNGYTPEDSRDLLANRLFKSLPENIQVQFQKQCQEFATLIYLCLTETHNRIPLNYMLMVFLCMRAKTREDILNYLQCLPAHFFRNGTIVTDPNAQLDVNAFTNDQYIHMTQETLTSYSLIEQLFLQTLNKGTAKITRSAVKRLRNQFITSCAAALNAPNTSLMNSNKELFMAQNAQEVENAIKAGADINARNLFGATALHCAVMGENMKTTSALLAQKADAHALDKNSYTPLMHAVTGRNLALVKLLLKYESDPETRIQHARVARKLAIKDQDIRCVLNQSARGEVIQ